MTVEQVIEMLNTINDGADANVTINGKDILGVKVGIAEAGTFEVELVNTWNK